MKVHVIILWKNAKKAVWWANCNLFISIPLNDKNKNRFNCITPFDFEIYNQSSLICLNVDVVVVRCCAIIAFLILSCRGMPEWKDYIMLEILEISHHYNVYFDLVTCLIDCHVYNVALDIVDHSHDSYWEDPIPTFCVKQPINLKPS